MKRTVFYSWQSDLPNATNRTLIETALKEAAKEIADDESIDIDPVIDRDTQGASGAPDIATTIFGKIAEADLFVADITFVASSKRRSFPNPNVLIELGYALKAKGHESLVLVFNDAYGKLEKLPFDLKMRRVLTYTATEGEADRSATKASLTRDFKAALLTGFASLKPPAKTISIIDIIQQNPAAKVIHLRKHLAEVLSELEALQPIMPRDGGTAEDLISAIATSEPISLAFAQLSETVALMNDMDSAKEIFQWFGKILEKYNPPSNATGRTTNGDGDFFKFIGNELFVMFVLPFFKEERWDQLRELLSGTLKVAPRQHRTDSTKEPWHELSEWMPVFADESKRKNRISVHDDLLRARHTTGALAQIAPYRDYEDVDFFLYLHGPGTTSKEYGANWYPRSILFAQHTPSFVLEAKDYTHAMKICQALAISDVDELKRRLTSSRATLKYDWHSPITDTEIQGVGSEGGAVIIH